MRLKLPYRFLSTGAHAIRVEQLRNNNIDASFELQSCTASELSILPWSMIRPSSRDKWERFLPEA